MRAAGVTAWPLALLSAVLLVAMASFLAFVRLWRDLRLPGAARPETGASPV